MSDGKGNAGRTEAGDGMRHVTPAAQSVRESFRWTLRLSLRLWWYNAVKRHWQNFLWWLLTWTDPELRAKYHGKDGRRFLAYCGAMTRADLEWAAAAFFQTDGAERVHDDASQRQW